MYGQSHLRCKIELMNKKAAETRRGISAYILNNDFQKVWIFYSEKQKPFVKRNLNTAQFLATYKGCPRVKIRKSLKQNEGR